MITSTISGTLTTLSYDAAGRLKERELGSQGLASVYDYYPWTNQGGRLEILTSGPGGDPDGLQNLTYAYDDVGNILSIADAVNGGPQTQTFTYDDIYRLITAQASGGGQGNYAQQSYSYDPNSGNLASKAGVTYTYGDGSHAHAVTALSNGNTYTYDANGNMTQRYVSGQTFNLAYDAENHMTGVSGAASAAFVYNGDGQRVISTLGNDTTVFIGNYFEWHVASDQATQYYYSETSRIAMRTSAGGLQFILGDHLGSSSVMADPSGALLSSQGYMPWGEMRFGSVGTEYQYTGQFRQSALGLDYFNARWYDPNIFRFISPDTLIPLNPQGAQAFDRYAYANNNPTKYIDPTGHSLSDGCQTEGCNYGADQRRQDILTLHNILKKNVKAGVITDLEALATLSNYAADLSGNNDKSFVEDSGATLTGHTGSSALNELRVQAGRMVNNNPTLNRNGEYKPNATYNPNYLSVRGAGELNQSGYAPEYQDPNEGMNQAHHFWFYLQVGYESGVVVATAGNILHETIISNGAAGRSTQDFALGEVGAGIGQMLAWGAMKPSEVGPFILIILGE